MKTYEDKDYDGMVKEIPDYADESREAKMAAAAEAERIEREFQEEAEAKRRKSQRTTSWVLGIVGVLCVGFIIAWIIGWNNDRRAENMASVRFVQPVKMVYVKTVAADANGKIQMVPGSSSVAKSVASTSGSSNYQSRIEREAREVIHGDYGVNPGRKAMLGADYAAVQARVNQLLAAN